jgi:ABC-type nitrate/sulfonate/bicarbonate transport system substrate-binding protein
MRAWKFRLTIMLVPILWIGSALPARADAIRVFYFPPWNVSKLPLYFARDTGIFHKNGLDISWRDPGSNDNLLAAMKNGAGDIYVVSSNHVVRNNVSGGPPLIVIGNTGYNYSVLLVEATIKQPEDLKGKKIGTAEAGSTPDLLTRLALRRLGLDPDRDVALIHFDEDRSADRAGGLLSGKVAASLVTAEAMYDLEKTGDAKRFHILADHKKLNIYAGGGADYAVSAAFLKNHRPEVKSFMSGICEGTALAKKDKAKALDFVAKTVRKSDPALVEYLRRLYVEEVIPARPYPKTASVELGIQMVAPGIPAAGGLKPEQIIDATLVQELEKEGRCNF